MRRRALIFLVVALFFGSAGFVPAQSQAVGATLSLIPAQGSYTVGEEFVIDVKLNTHGVSVTGVAAYLTYDSSKLDASIQGVSPEFNLQGKEGVYPDKNLIEINRASSKGVNSKDFSFAKIKLKAKADGIAKVSFSRQAPSESQVALVAGSTAKNILTEAQGASFTIEAQEKKSIFDPIVSGITQGLSFVGNLFTEEEKPSGVPTPPSTTSLREYDPNEIELDIPPYLPEALKHSQKIFSGRAIRIKGGFTSPSITLISKKTTKTLEVKKIRKDYIVSIIPLEIETDSYTIAVKEGTKPVKSISLQIHGLTAEEKVAGKRLFARGVEEPAIIKRTTIPCCYWEMVMAGDPVNKKHLVLSDSGNLIRTEDGFVSWQHDNVEGADPKLLAVGGDLFFRVGAGQVKGGFFYSGSIRGGKVEQTTIRVVPEGDENEEVLLDYPKIAYDKTNEIIYVSGVSFGGPPGPKMYMSRDNGKSFSSHSYARGSIEEMEVGVDSYLYAAYADFLGKIKIIRSAPGDPSNFAILDGPPISLEFSARLSQKSKRVWYVFPGPIIKIDKSTSPKRGRIYLAWAEPALVRHRQNDEDFEKPIYGFDYNIFSSRSDDQGKTWSPPIRVNDDTSQGDQVFPSMAVDEKGGVHLAWLDHRDGQDLEQFDVYYATSSDGENFSKNIKLNTVPTLNTFGARSVGDYLDMVVAYSDLVYVGFPCGESEIEGVKFGPTSVCVVQLDPEKVEQAAPVAPVQKIEGDLNGDGVADIIDIGILMSTFGKKDELGAKFNPKADFNNDGVVDIFDVVVVSRNWGK